MCFKTCTTRAGNGDILTHYEAAERMRTGVSGVMVGRGALIKPWIFGEHRDGASWEPSANERVKSRTPDFKSRTPDSRTDHTPICRASMTQLS